MKTITPQPGHTSAEVTALLASRNYAYADCYTITPIYGEVMRLTIADTPTTVMSLDDVPGVVTYEHRSNLQISGVKLKMGVGVEVDEQSMTIQYDATATQWGLPFPQALRLGRLDGATIRRDRFFRKDFDSPWLGGCPMFRGLVSSIDSMSRIKAEVKVKSDLVLLDVQMPKDLYQPGCNHRIYDPGCTLDKSAFVQHGIVETGSTQSVINWTGSTTGLTLGMIYITTTDGVTLVRTIRSATTTQLFLAYPLELPPVTGAHFDVYPGCDRTYTRCTALANTAHFKGYPFVPVAETAA